jgi:hypothetical protein
VVSQLCLLLAFLQNLHEISAAETGLGFTVYSFVVFLWKCWSTCIWALCPWTLLTLFILWQGQWTMFGFTQNFCTQMPLPINGHLEVFCLWPPFCLSPLFPHTHCLDIQVPQQDKKISLGLTKYKICFGCWTAIAELLDNAIDEVKEQSFSFFLLCTSLAPSSWIWFNTRELWNAYKKNSIITLGFCS